jgi:hypothetical protein
MPAAAQQRSNSSPHWSHMHHCQFVEPLRLIDVDHHDHDDDLRMRVSAAQRDTRAGRRTSSTVHTLCTIPDAKHGARTHPKIFLSLEILARNHDNGLVQWRPRPSASSCQRRARGAAAFAAAASRLRGARAVCVRCIRIPAASAKRSALRNCRQQVLA